MYFRIRLLKIVFLLNFISTNKLDLCNAFVKEAHIYSPMHNQYVTSLWFYMVGTYCNKLNLNIELQNLHAMLYIAKQQKL